MRGARDTRVSRAPLIPSLQAQGHAAARLHVVLGPDVGHDQPLRDGGARAARPPPVQRVAGPELHGTVRTRAAAPRRRFAITADLYWIDPKRNHSSLDQLVITYVSSCVEQLKKPQIDDLVRSPKFGINSLRIRSTRRSPSHIRPCYSWWWSRGDEILARHVCHRDRYSGYTGGYCMNDAVTTVLLNREARGRRALRRS